AQLFRGNEYDIADVPDCLGTYHVRDECQAPVRMIYLSSRIIFAAVELVENYRPLAVDIFGADECSPHPIGFDFDGQRQVFAREQFVIVCADRKSTRLNSSHVKISYAVFCLKKKTSSV